MKKLIFILLFSIIATASFAQAAAASARMFKDANAWAQREFLRTSRSYTLDTAELYGLIGFTKDCKGHTNWQYATSDIRNTFASLFPILGRNNSFPIKDSYIFFQTNVRYTGHELQFVGSPTFTNNSVVFNGTTQYATLRYFRDWSNNFQNMTPQFLMDSILSISPTDTLSQTNMNLSIYMKDSTNRMRLGSGDVGSFRILNVSGDFRSLSYNNTSNEGLLISGSISNASGLYVTARQQLTHKIYLNGIEVATNTNGSYNFGLARQNNSVIQIQALNNANFVSGTVQYLAILNRGLNSTEQIAYYNAVREFIRRKTQ